MLRGQPDETVATTFITSPPFSQVAEMARGELRAKLAFCRTDGTPLPREELPHDEQDVTDDGQMNHVEQTDGRGQRHQTRRMER